ncbi:hypothetical protein EVAR_61747_1 [Eumeta japonica]|uniref:Uncharacterized protein n=1 Tax=Eumeta variegata TaxID=151549 RepID=A0A4C1YIJ7_EUMVA|nr:hypothetical protein EVAR_61747_1 [Eumeta japonica]
MAARQDFSLIGWAPAFILNLWRAPDNSNRHFISSPAYPLITTEGLSKVTSSKLPPSLHDIPVAFVSHVERSRASIALLWGAQSVRETPHLCASTAYTIGSALKAIQFHFFVVPVIALQHQQQRFDGWRFLLPVHARNFAPRTEALK